MHLKSIKGGSWYQSLSELLTQTKATPQALNAGISFRVCVRSPSGH